MKTCPGVDGLTREFYKIFKENTMPVIHKLLGNRENNLELNLIK